MICDLCNKKASVHLTEIVDDQMSEMHLCEECAGEKSAQMEQQCGLADLLAGLGDFGKQVKRAGKPAAACENCGMRYEDFRKLGRLGCSQCYNVFRENLSDLLKKVHGSNQHFGKAPVKMSPQEKEKVESLQGLKSELLRSIQSEDFEKAAELRDKIRSLERKDK